MADTGGVTEDSGLEGQRTEAWAGLGEPPRGGEVPQQQREAVTTPSSEGTSGGALREGCHGLDQLPPSTEENEQQTAPSLSSLLVSHTCPIG